MRVVGMAALSLVFLVALNLLLLEIPSAASAHTELADALGLTNSSIVERDTISNITGTLRGKWNIVNGFEGIDEGNTTSLWPWMRATSGPVVISLHQGPAKDDVSFVNGVLTLREGDFVSEADASMPFEGVYVLQTGELRLLLESKIVGNVTEAEKKELGKTYRDALADMVAELRGTSSPALPRARVTHTTHNLQCKHLLHYHDFVARLSDLSELQEGGGLNRLRKRCTVKLNTVIARGEDELGDEAATLSGHLFSPNCGFRIALNATEVHLGHYYMKAENFSLMVTVATMVLIALVHQQLELSSTQAGLAGVSLMCIGQQAVLDSYMCLVHLTTGLVVDDLFGAFAGTAFVEFILFSFFEMKLMVLIWKARRPEQFSQGNWRREMGVLHSYFYIALLVGVIVIYQLSDFVEYIVFAFYSFWVWQIAHNVQHDTPRPLLPKYIIGTSAARLLLPLYVFGCPKNFIRSDPEYRFCGLLVGWVGLQVAVLLSQGRLGPRWFVPRRWRPQKYDYHREVPQSVLDGIGGGDAEEGLGGGAEVDCVICMAPVEPHRLDARMVTPCDHFFHNACMLRWMQVKLECPTCRRPLPTP